MDASPEAGPDVLSALNEGAGSPIAEPYSAARSVPPLGSVEPGRTLALDGTVTSELMLTDAFLALDPFSEQATDAIPALRAAVRAVVMPLYVVATVLLSFGFALGVSSLVFTHLMGQPASDPMLPLFCFIFLDALGVDYNVFLLARIREERGDGFPTPEAATRALERTGGVITSAGLVLAATFSTLMALPLVSLFQIGFVIALGLLADTFLIRALLAPATAVKLGERNWWPRRVAPSGPEPAVRGR